MKSSDYYNKTEIYQNKLSGIVRKIKSICNMEKIPMFVTFAVANSEDRTTYRSDMILASTELSLTEDNISKLLLRLNEFEVEPPEYIRQDIRELKDYLNKIESTKNIAEHQNVILTNDYIADMQRIAASGGEIVPPDEIVSRPITDEFLDD